MRVLLLEDDIALSDLLNEHLEDKGFEVTLCTNGQEALENLIEFTIKLFKTWNISFLSA